VSRRDRSRAQIKGDSYARLSREKELSERVYTLRGKRTTTQRRRHIYVAALDPDGGRGRWSGGELRALRAARGVGRPPRLLRPQWSYKMEV